MKSPVPRKILFLLALLTLTGLIEAVLFGVYLRLTEADRSFMNQAGRLQMLSERLGRADAHWRAGRTPGGELGETASLFERKLRLLQEGGEEDGERFPPAPDQVANQLDDVALLWDRMAPLVAQLTTLSPDDQAAPRVYQRLRALVPRLTAACQGVTDAFNAKRQILRSRLRAASIGMVALSILAFLAALHFTRSYVLRPIRLIEEATRRAREGAPVPMPATSEVSEDEFGTVTLALRQLTENLDRLQAQRSQMKEQLRLTAAEYQSIFENSVVGIFQYFQDGRLRSANPAMARILGYESPADLLLRFNDSASDLAELLRGRLKLDKLWEDNEVSAIEAPVRRKDGSRVWVLIGARPVGAGEVPVTHCDAVLVDITKRKQAEEALRRLSGRLLQLQDEEHRRIGRELHDSTGQVLAALEMNLNRVQDQTHALDRAAQESLADCLSLVQQASQEIRSFSYLLHPPFLDEFGVAFAIRHFADGFSQRSGVDVELEIPRELGRLSRDAETALFRIVQESLANVHRHSNSKQATIRFSLKPGQIQMEVRDFGDGIPSELLGDADVSDLGVGLRGMQARMRQLGGRLEIERAKPGTMVRAVLPVSVEGAPQPVRAEPPQNL